MNILVLAPEQLPVPPVKGGSVETCIYEIHKRIASTDQVTIVSRASSGLPEQEIVQDRKLRMIRVARGGQNQYVHHALKKIAGEDFDVIQIDNRPRFVPYVRKKFPRTPIVLTLHSLYFMSRLSKSEADRVLQQVHTVTCVSSFLAHAMKKRFPDFAFKFKAVTLGVDTQQYRPRPESYKQHIRQKWGVADTFNILYLGRITHGKGLHVLVRAMSHVKKHNRRISLIAVGSSWPGVKPRTKYIQNVLSQAKRAGIKIISTGYIRPSRVNKMYHLGDVFVCPTQLREGLALVNLEAMASGIPVVASRLGGIKEVIQDSKYGILISDYKNPHAFARAIIEFKNNPELAQRLAQAGRQRVLSFYQWANTAENMRNVYESAIRKRNQQVTNGGTVDGKIGPH